MEEGAYTVSEVWDNLASDPTVASDEERCFIYRSVVAWWPETRPEAFMDGTCEG